MRTMLMKYSSEKGKPSINYALAVITLHVISSVLVSFTIMKDLNSKFTDHSLLMTSLVMFSKEILSFVSAPIVGTLSDVWGRKMFLFITVFCNCVRIPFMAINTWWFFAMVAISGVFDVTLPVIFAYIADVTTTEGRSMAFGLVSAAFLATATGLSIVYPLCSEVLHPHGDSLIVAFATIIAVLNVIFTYSVVPESLPENLRPSSSGTSSGWRQVHPFKAIKRVGLDHTILIQCVTILLSYTPEAAKYVILYAYLKLVKGFSSVELTLYMLTTEVLSILALLLLGICIRKIGAKRTIILGLVSQAMQLLLYGLGSRQWMMWTAAILAALGSITHPAMLAFVSINSHADTQGVVIGIISGTRSLCIGLGPLIFNVLLFVFNKNENVERSGESIQQNINFPNESISIPGWILACSAIMVVIAILVELSIPTKPKLVRRASDEHYEKETEGEVDATTLSPIMQQSSA